MKCFSYKNFSFKGLAVLVFFTFFISACEDYPTYYQVESNPPESSFSSAVNNFEVTFTNKASHATSYSWDFGDGTTSTDKDVIHTYGAKGKYTVTLTAKDKNGLEATSSAEVPVGFPIALFSYEALKLNVQFTNNSVNASSYSWDFGDGTTSEEENPAHTFPAEGSYTVILTAIDGSDESTTSQDIYVVGKYQPIILSPSFEGETSVYRVDWDWNGASGSGSPTPPDGTNAAKFGSGTNWIAQTFTVEANTDYKVRYWFVTKAGATIGLKIKVLDGTDGNIVLFDGQTGASAATDAYQEANFEFNSGNSTSVTLRFDYGDQETRLDLISIE